MSGTSNSNPGNFANRPTEEVKEEIASLGGKASHKDHSSDDTHEKRSDQELAKEGRAPDGSFLPGGAAASEAGHKGGLHSHDNDGRTDEKLTFVGKDLSDKEPPSGRNPDGTFTPGSEAAKIAGHKGGVA